MSDIQFEEQSYTSDVPNKKIKKVGGITRLIISWGFAKDERSANMIMIGLIFILCVVSFIALT